MLGSQVGFHSAVVPFYAAALKLSSSLGDNSQKTRSSKAVVYVPVVVSILESEIRNASAQAFVE